MKYRMLAIDLDGTLLDCRGGVSAANRAAVERARDAGLLVVLCTGRGLTESRPAIKALDHHGPIVLACGAVVADPTTGKTLHKAVIEPQLAGQIIEHLDPQVHNVIALLDPEVEGCDYLVVNESRMNSNTRWWFDMIGARLKCVACPSAQDLHHVLRVGIVAPPAVMVPVQASLEERFGSRIVVQHFMAVRMDENEVEVLEVFAQGVNKWAGLCWLAEEHGIPHGQIAAIGDQINDVSMIRHAACGIAMGNAVPAVLDVAHRVTTTNDESGVAHAIEHLLDGRW